MNLTRLIGWSAAIVVCVAFWALVVGAVAAPPYKPTPGAGRVATVTVPVRVTPEAWVVILRDRLALERRQHRAQVRRLKAEIVRLENGRP